MTRMTKAQAEKRAQAICKAMPKWAIHAVRKDGTAVFEIDTKSGVTYIEFHPEHWAAFDAVCNL